MDATPNGPNANESPQSLFLDEEEVMERPIVEEDESSSESDLEWEEVEIAGDPAVQEPADSAPDRDDPSVLTIVPSAGVTPKPTTRRPARRPLSASEKQLRLAIHKVHLLCLLTHVSKRNHLCNDSETQAILKRLVPPKVITQLHVELRYSQLQRTKAFTESLQHILELWLHRFKITATGLRKPRWSASLDALQDYKLGGNAEHSIDRVEFRRAAKSLEGSADLGAQLLCCLLRAVGVETRLVCSLQPLPLGSSAEPTPQTPSESTPARQTLEAQKRTIYVTDEEEASVTRSAKVVAASRSSSATNASITQQVSRISQPRAVSTTTQASPSTGTSRRIPRPSHPIYWTEVFNPAYQKWLSVDALCTETVNRPSHIEPALNDPTNTLTYTVAFNEDGTAKDVTPRYTRQYNAKIRKHRLEYMDGNSGWWTRVMHCFQYPGRKSDRDVIEDGELEQRITREGMPGNIQDFKGHPIYALERHLKSTEVIHPRREIGKVNAGTAKKPRMEDVFRRSDVHLCRSADRWFRLGREVKVGEAPLRYGQPKRNRRQLSVDEIDDDRLRAFGEERGDGLYAVFQTELYVPPPVVRGKVPRNAYGNLDVYVSSMVPKGGVHVKHPDAKAAARILGIDYAEAVGGFKFQGRKGTAVIQGVVVAKEYAQAMAAVIQGLQKERISEAEAKRSLEMLRLWKRFLIGLRIKERVKQYQTDIGDDGLDAVRDVDDDLQREIDEEMDLGDELEQAGGFFADQSLPVALPTANKDNSIRAEEDAVFLPDNLFDFGSPERPERTVKATNNVSREAREVFAEDPTFQPPDEIDSNADVDGGGFITNDQVANEASNAEHVSEGGGFIIEEAEKNGASLQLHKEEQPATTTSHGKQASLAETSKKSDGSPDIKSPHPEMGDDISPHLNDEAESDSLDVSKDFETQDLDLDMESPTDPAQEELDEMLEEAREEIDGPQNLVQDSDEDMDHGSLPSHDPEDEDADPEWIF